MDRRLLQPKWLLAHLVVLVVAVVFIRLGMWQLDRLEERRVENQVGSERYQAPPIPFEDLLVEASGDFLSIEHRRAFAFGTFDPGSEILIRSQVYLGTAGFHVITPLVGESGEAVQVNRGWVPLTSDEVPVVAAAPPTGEVTVEGWVHLTQTRPMLGRKEAEGGLSTFNRVDIARIQEQVPYPLASVYLVEIGEPGEPLPIPVEPPAFDDEGPHLAYAIQWFGFALIGVVGYGFLVRRRITRNSS